MGRRTEKEADKWIGVSDARKRKQIQDRLAQRARRMYRAFPYLQLQQINNAQANEMHNAKQKQEMSSE